MASFFPAVYITVPFNPIIKIVRLERIPRVNHDGNLVSLFSSVGHSRTIGFRVRAMWKPCGMVSAHSGLHVISTEKLALVIKNELVVIIIGMIVRQFQGPRIALDRSWAEGAT